MNSPINITRLSYDLRFKALQNQAPDGRLDQIRDTQLYNKARRELKNELNPGGLGGLMESMLPRTITTAGEFQHVTGFGATFGLLCEGLRTIPTNITAVKNGKSVAVAVRDVCQDLLLAAGSAAVASAIGKFVLTATLHETQRVLEQNGWLRSPQEAGLILLCFVLSGLCAYQSGKFINQKSHEWVEGARAALKPVFKKIADAIPDFDAKKAARDLGFMKTGVKM